MSQVEKTIENLKKCVCMKCPSYTMGCKMKSMPSNIMGMISGISKRDHFEGLYCAFEESRCIKERKGCTCAGCPVYKENNLEKLYFCVTKDGE